MAETTDNIRASSTYLDVEFVLAKDWRFYVPCMNKGFDSKREMEVAIDALQKAQEKLSRRKVAIPVMNGEGVETTFVGIHAGHGRVMMKPDVKIGGMFSDTLYPAVGWIRDSLLKIADLEKQVEAVRKQLMTVAVNVDTKYNYSPSQYESRLDGLEKAFAAAKAKAEKIGGVA